MMRWMGYVAEIGDQECIQNFEWEEMLWKTRLGWDSNIK
jgi:hypothetical protein